MVRRVLSTVVLTVVYCVAILLSFLFGRLPFWRTNNGRGVLIIATFHNRNWYLSHVRPLLAMDRGQVTVVCDEPMDGLDNVIFACPTSLISKLVSRAVAKAVIAARYAISDRPAVCIGYHIFPGAITALVVARLIGAKAVYQCTSGPLELAGGGWRAENVVLRALGGPSKWIESLVRAVINQFDLVVVRGTAAEQFLTDQGARPAVVKVTGSISVPQCRMPQIDRDIDVLFVGRLSATKRVDRFLEIISQTKRYCPDIAVVVIGDGPQRSEFFDEIVAKDLSENINFIGQRDDCQNWMRRAKTFLLTSDSEGVSIAMLEAMAEGAVPIVSNVGDLGDVVQDSVNGYLVEKTDIARFSHVVSRVLEDGELWELLSAAAQRTAIQIASVPTIADKLNHAIDRIK